jgi:pyruvate kinase
MSLRHDRNIRIVATLGPASNRTEVIRDLVSAGANVFRLNMSHGSHAEIKDLHRVVRDVEAQAGRPIGILADLQGPKLRIGRITGGSVMLQEGKRVRLVLSDAPGDEQRVPLPHPEIFAALKNRATLLVDDGRIRLRVEGCGAEWADCRVEVGGKLSDRKGVNVPGVVLPIAALTEKDRADLDFVCDLGIDWLALSFVQRPEDVHQARALVAGRAAVMAKIEKPAAVENLDAIIEASDGIMVARGDLGVELSVQDVPPCQKRIVRACRAAAKPVVVATQMLESMIQNPVPTRAEVSDVATALYEGADCVMLSAESAAGAHPVAAVAMMDAIARRVEADPTYAQIMASSKLHDVATVASGIAEAACTIAARSGLGLICAYTESGTTARLVARERPAIPILALTPTVLTARRLCLSWGTKSLVIEQPHDEAGAVAAAVKAAVGAELVAPQDPIVVTAGIPFSVAGSTNFVRVAF